MAKYVSENNLSSILLKLKDVCDIKYAASENPEIEGTVSITGYPVNSNHLTTKDYVDRQVSNLSYSFVSEEEVDTALINIFGEVEIANYVATAAGVMPTFNDDFVNYSLRESLNDDSTYDVSVLSVTGELPTSMTFQDIDKINQINYINLERIENVDNIFNNCSKLNFVKLTSIKHHIINAIINSLPDRTGLEQGTIIISECDMSQIDVEVAQNKNWIINVEE